MTVTPATKQIVRNRQNGRCAICNGPLDTLIAKGAYRIEYDHIKPRWLGGPNDPVNIQALHRRCHRTKTNGDVADFWKCERRIEGETAHAEAMATGKRRPNARERKLMRMAESRERLSERQP